MTTRRNFLKVLGAAGLGLSCTTRNELHAGTDAGADADGGPVTTPSPDEYNIVWIMSDEHNPYVAGYAGDPFIDTPAIDSIAMAGTIFSAGYCQDPICVPSRQSFHSGRMASNIQADNYEALGSYFSRMGFATAWYGKAHWDDLVNEFQDEGENATKIIKDRFEAAGIPFPDDNTRLVADAHTVTWGTDLNKDSVTTEQALAFLDANASKRFFLGVSYVKPHFPFAIQSQYVEKYQALNIPEPTVTQAMLDDLSTAMKADRIQYGIDTLTSEQSTFGRAVYYGMIDFVDEQVALVLKKLDDLGIRQRTIVIYVADHGEMMGQHGIWYKNAFYEGSARVPYVISVPSGYGSVQKKIDAPVGLIDLFPTLCEICALEAPAHLEGKSLVALLKGSEDGADRIALSENKRRGIPARMIRTKKYKYCYYEDGIEHLFDMSGSDRDVEAVNLAKDPAYQSIKADLKARALLSWNPDGLSDDGD